MTEAHRRREPGSGGSAVRRLMARPIRAHIAGAAQPHLSVIRTDEAASIPAPAATVAPTLPETDDVARLRMEVLMMKAALAAERRESEALRTSLGLGDAQDLGDEARAERERWAALVGRLIHGTL
ncbi:hypothetical protein ASG52_12735 [Methylobacterium sp. Leaf456]|uniref:hypothetical protein n=1 Tax=Methylobacterium sp. Leaf456 TaxID=1736382 RepID=UPI0006FB3242|nr:hypothetical protein [Methylobacterium sp. Leaf456]KQT46580.1 hypothetical protein ASG52_12735 [Methylobacterium sp. Leaf456]